MLRIQGIFQSERDHKSQMYLLWYLVEENKLSAKEVLTHIDVTIPMVIVVATILQQHGILELQ